MYSNLLEVRNYGKITLRCATVSMVEHTAVNRGVVGLSPTRGGVRKAREHQSLLLTGRIV